MKSGSLGAEANPIAVALFGSGQFAIAPFEAIRLRSQELGVRIACVVTQPDRKAGRGQASQATAVGAWAIAKGLTLIRTADANDPRAREAIRGGGVLIFVVVAFGQRLGDDLLQDIAAVNLHGSILPAWRGAAPIQRSLMAGDARLGVSVIEVAPRMDGGRIFATAETEPIAGEIAAELHDRLSALGVAPLVEVVAKLAAFMRRDEGERGCARGAIESLGGRVQDESAVTRAKKLARADAWVDFTATAREVAARINGLSPWPGVDATILGSPLRVLRARVDERGGIESTGTPGEVLAQGSVACGVGCVEILEVQAPGGRPVVLSAYLNGRRLGCGVRIESRSPAANRGGQL
ncbi:MAG: methionyl-tRNA formyltransferase [Phycisphaerales bacterium]|nr:methionyl-tRNA formyltransferase [Phycisphaerales bacterium]